MRNQSVQPGSVTIAAASRGRRFLSALGMDMRSGEGAAAFLFFLYNFLLFTSFYTSKAMRQSTFVDSLGADRLPFVYLLVALCSYPAMQLYGLVAERLKQHQHIALFSVSLAVSMIAFWVLYLSSWTWVPVVFYLWITIAFGIGVSQFWSYSNHTFDPRQAKRLFGFLAAGGAIGGIAGGQLAHLTTDSTGRSYALLVVAGLLLGIAGLVVLIERRGRLGRRDTGESLDEIREARGGFAAIRRSPYLQLIAALMLLTVVVAQVVDLQFNWAVEQSTEDFVQRTALFGHFYSLVGLGAFVFHLLLTARIHRFLGVGFAMRVLPVTMAVGTGALMVAAPLGVMPLLIAAWCLKIADGGLRHSVDQVTRELLFLPVPSGARLRAKAFIDVFVQRFAKGVAALLLLTVTFKLMNPVQAGWLTFGLIILWLAVTVITRRYYVTSYRTRLRAGALDAEAVIDFSDVVTVEVLVQSLGSPDPRQVLHSLELLSSQGRGRLVPPLLLYHDDALVRRRTLEVLADTGRQDAVPLVERSLGDIDPDVRAQAVRTLAALQRDDACEMMIPRLRNPDSRVRAAAIACLATHGQGQMVDLASAALSEMLSDAIPGVRAEAAKCIGEIPEPAYQQQLVQLLYDNDETVVREAVAAVRQRLTRAGSTPIYVPTLIALMRDRRLKHDCREALVACGEGVIPALNHFMNDPQEQIWVRRAAPKTLARIGGRVAAKTLVASLGARDPFQRRKVIEALATLRSTGVDLAFGTGGISEQIREEAQQYLEALALLEGLGTGEGARFEGPLLRWEKNRPPTLLRQLLAERMRDRVENLFGMLALLHPLRDIQAAQRSLFSESPALRSDALEYLDNTLSGEVHRYAFAVIGDVEVGEKLRRAERLFAIVVRSPQDTLRLILASPSDGDPDWPALIAASLHTVYADEVSELYPMVLEVRDRADEYLTRETADWVVRRLDMREAG